MAKKRLREKTDLRRPTGNRRERSRILVVTEGEQTELQYFKGLCRFLRATGVSVTGVDVKTEGRDPLSVVNRARRETRNEKLVGARDGFNAVWCVVDVDDHETLPEAVELAQRMKFNVAVSNPCFEMWLLFHFEACTRYTTRSELRAKLRKFGVDGKSIPSGFPYKDAPLASKRAPRFDGAVPENPGSGVHALSDYLHAGVRES
ncbi:RloB family protein [Saccharopolyspora flava]|uniref:RloB-like protein n=1 Tax=Saccharopolyspora flava TaxID=95161 RepID=A0A1I6QSU1_9PSEU|nr:RloB family protein [Saccharopolyspora flava]SFS55511.1 RloB-like protein [Saccharopolyspora flava]